MPERPPTVTGLVCTDDDQLGRAAALLMHNSGLRLLGVAKTIADAVGIARRFRPQAIVADVAVLGIEGLSVLPTLLEAAPGCVLAVVSPFPALSDAALATGAEAVVDPSDLRPLFRMLTAVRAQYHAGYACTCCRPPPPPPLPRGTAAGFDPQFTTLSGPQGPDALLWKRPDGSPKGGTGTGSTGSQGANGEKP